MQNYIITFENDKVKTVNEIVKAYAGCPSELKRQFKANSMSYIKTKRGFYTYYVISDNKGFKLKIRL